MLRRLRHLVVWCLPSVWLPESSLQMKWTGCRIVWLSHTLWSAWWSTLHKACTVLWPFKKPLNNQCRQVQKGESTQWNITALLLLTQGFRMVELQRTNFHRLVTAAANPLQSAHANMKWEEVLQESAISEQVAGVVSTSSPKADAIMEKRSEEHLLPKYSNPLKWWESCSQERLCIVALSVPSERVLSRAGQITSEEKLH